MQKGIYIVMGQLTVKEFIEALFETQRKPPAFAMPAWAEAVISFETLNKRHTNPDEGGFTNGYRTTVIPLNYQGMNNRTVVRTYRIDKLPPAGFRGRVSGVAVS